MIKLVAYSANAMIRNAEALGGKNVSRDAVKKGEFSVAF